MSATQNKDMLNIHIYMLDSEHSEDENEKCSWELKEGRDTATDVRARRKHVIIFQRAAIEFTDRFQGNMHGLDSNTANSFLTSILH